MASPPGTRDSCVVVLLIGGSLLAGVGYLLTEAVRWFV